MATPQMITFLGNETVAYLNTLVSAGYAELSTNLALLFAQPQEDVDAAIAELVAGGLVTTAPVSGGLPGQMTVTLASPGAFTANTGDANLDTVLNELYARATASGALPTAVQTTITSFTTALASGPTAGFTPSTGVPALDSAFTSLLATVRSMLAAGGSSDQLGPFLVAVGAFGYDRGRAVGHARFMANVALLSAAVTQQDAARELLFDAARATQMLADKMPTA